jgi:deazaflavin-dependent oxidoreductase (nitroreductase family)
VGLADDLGYRFPSVGPVRRAVQRLSSTRPVSRALARVLPPLDTLTRRVTAGRHALPGVVVGLPVLDLTTRGRRSGALRTTHLVAVPHAGTLALIGTNFGGARTPAWVHNLEATPEATVTDRGRSRAVRARPAGPAERESVLARAETLYVGYRRYLERITGRRLRVFVLEPLASGGPAQEPPDT